MKFIAHQIHIINGSVWNVFSEGLHKMNFLHFLIDSNILKLILSPYLH